MMKLDFSTVKSWSGNINARNNIVHPTTIDVDCPNLDCQKSLVNARLEWTVNSTVSYSENTCANCGIRIRFLLIDPPRKKESSGLEGLDNSILMIIPPKEVDVEINPLVEDLSPNFSKIYKQSAESELHGLTEICGLGYRKSLEFLIKDYLIEEKPDDAEKFKKSTLNQCITNFITHERLKEVAKRTAWLGNDEAHYERKWEERDLNDLKALLQISMMYISSELEAKNYIDEMPAPSKKKK